MFGYTEHTHTVISTQTIVRAGHEAQLDVRRPTPDNYWAKLLEDPSLSPRKRDEWARQVEGFNRMPDYLVLVREGNPTYLLYEAAFPDANSRGAASKETGMTRLQEDLAKLIAEPNVDLATLQWSELVQNDTGYGKDGCIIMY